MRPIDCNALILGILPSLDHGPSVSLEETYDHIQDGTLPTWLPTQLDDQGKLDISIVSPDAWAELMPFMADQQPPREFSISKNGLAYLIALANEGIQHLNRPVR